jgi:hypothetical protein
MQSCPTGLYIETRYPGEVKKEEKKRKPIVGIVLLCYRIGCRMYPPSGALTAKHTLSISICPVLHRKCTITDT